MVCSRSRLVSLAPIVTQIPLRRPGKQLTSVKPSFVAKPEGNLTRGLASARHIPVAGLGSRRVYNLR